MTVLFRNGQRKYNVDARLLKSQTGAVLEHLNCHDSEVSILLVSDAKIRKLNYQYRTIDKPTDVLSFPQEDENPSELDFRLLGDIVISAETARRQAREHGLSFNEELVLLIIHGILHLLGFDHERSAKEDRQMRQKTYILFQKIFPGKKPGGAYKY